MDDLIEENEEMDELLQGMIQNGQGNSSQAKELQQQIDQNATSKAMIQKLANQIAEEMDDLIEEDDIANEISTKAGKAFDEASMQVAETSEMVEVWGLGEGENVVYLIRIRKMLLNVFVNLQNLKILQTLLVDSKNLLLQNKRKRLNMVQ